MPVLVEVQCILIASVGEYLKYKYLKYYFKYMNSILYLYFKYFLPEVFILVFKILLHEYLVF